MFQLILKRYCHVDMSIPSLLQMAADEAAPPKPTATELNCEVEEKMRMKRTPAGPAVRRRRPCWVMMGFSMFLHQRGISQNGIKWMVYRGKSYLVWMILGSCHFWKPNETSIWFMVAFTNVRWNIPDDLTYPWIILSHWSLPEVGWEETEWNLGNSLKTSRWNLHLVWLKQVTSSNISDGQTVPLLFVKLHFKVQVSLFP